jgi:4-amino-4-deoxychorismate lyase
MMAYPVWVDGKENGCLDPADRGLAYGDGLFETLRVEAGRVVFLDLHLARLQAGARALDIPLDSHLLLQELLRFLTNCPATCIAKIIVTRGSGGRGYLYSADLSPSIILSAHPLSAYPESFQAEGIDAVLCTSRLALQPRLAGHKHLNRLEQVLLRQELAGTSADEGLVCDMQGRVVEGVFNNVFMVRLGELLTPRIEAAGIRGVFREAVIQESAAAGAPVREDELYPDDFLAADEVFFCNSVNGVWPVKSLAGRHWAPGTVTRYWQDYWRKQLG